MLILLVGFHVSSPNLKSSYVRAYLHKIKIKQNKQNHVGKKHLIPTSKNEKSDLLA